MQSRWRRLGIGLLGWLVSPSAAAGAVAAVVGAVLAVLAGLPAVSVFLIVLAALTAGLWLAHGVLSLYERLKRRELPFELKSEVVTIQRELVRMENRRIANGGSIWPIERPYVDLPTETWETHKDGLRLSKESKTKLSEAYGLTGTFNDEMLKGEGIIGSAPEREPDLAGLRIAFDEAAEIFDVPPLGVTPINTLPTRRFSRRDDEAELAQRCHMLASSVERWAQRFKSKESETTERMVDEWVEAEPSVEAAEARRKSYSRNEKNWELDYALRFGGEARDLFNRAFEMGEIAKEHEQLATRPLAIQFEDVPALFNEIAESLYAATDPSLQAPQ